MRQIPYVDKVESHYSKASGVMNALFAAGLNKSNNDNDMFFIISSDAIPVKPFNEIYRDFCEKGVRHVSQICIAPSNQWFPISKDSLVILLLKATLISVRMCIHTGLSEVLFTVSYIYSTYST